MPPVQSAGISVTPPAGCEARIRTRPAPAAGGGGADATAAEAHDVARPVLHISTAELVADRGDFGSGVVEAMGAGDALVVLVELDPAQAGSDLCRRTRLPRQVAPDRFSPAAMQRTVHGQSGLQVFFSEHGRAFCLYVVLGSHARRHELAPVVNRMLAGIEIAPR